MAIRQGTPPGQHFDFKNKPREGRLLKELSLQKLSASSLPESTGILQEKQSSGFFPQELHSEVFLGHWDNEARALLPVTGYWQGWVFSGG